MAEIIQEAYDILNSSDPARSKRINKIVALYKYRFRWKRKNFFNKVIEWIPELADELTLHSKKYHSTGALFAAMTLEHMNSVLARLEKIESSNKKRK